MEFTIEGFDELNRKLEELGKTAEELDGEQSISFEELFPETFMSANTGFETITQMIEDSGYKVESTEDFKQIPDNEWDAFVSNHTHFQDWKEMLNQAASEWAIGKLDL